MNVLWIANTIFPDAAVHMGLPPPVFGGWMYGLARDLAQTGELRLAVATVYNGKDLLTFEINGIGYYLVPRGSKGNGGSQDWARVVAQVSPSLVHIHGTEYGYGKALMDACPRLRYVLSIQGLVSVCYRYYLAGMTVRDVLSNMTFRDILRRDTIFDARNKFYKRGLAELSYIRKVDAVIGRTDWDYGHVHAIRPGVPYHFCNESLRDEFYSGAVWSLDCCNKYTIFLSQGSYPIKGLHQVLKAAALVRGEFPQIKIRIAGADITLGRTLSQRLRRGGYGRYVMRLIDGLDLHSNVEFVGVLDAEGMKSEYLKAHVFVCPSSIENSPNSLGEAQLLGVPSIASYVGGIPSMVANGKSALLYQFEEHEMLAALLRKVFSDVKLVEKLSVSSRSEALIRHDRVNNLKSMKQIYDFCCGMT